MTERRKTGATGPDLDRAGWTPEEAPAPGPKPNPSGRAVWITLDGETHQASEWARKKNIPVHTVIWRHNVGWTDRQVLGLDPPPPRRPSETFRLITINGETHHLSEWCRIRKLGRATVSARINRHGWTEAQALGFEPGPRSGARPRQPKPADAEPTALFRWRQGKGWGVEQTATALGLSASAVHMIEAGHREPSAATLRLMDYVDRFGLIKPSEESLEDWRRRHGWSEVATSRHFGIAAAKYEKGQQRRKDKQIRLLMAYIDLEETAKATA